MKLLRDLIDAQGHLMVELDLIKTRNKLKVN